MEVECVKVRKTDGDSAIKLIKRLDLANSEFKITHSDDFVFIPLKRKLSKANVKNLEHSVDYFEEKLFEMMPRQRRRSLIDVLEDQQLPQHIVSSVPKALDIIGHVSVLEIPSELKDYRKVIGEAILKTHKNVKSVLAKAGGVDGVYRLRKYELVAGDEKTLTIHREHGCRFVVDVKKTYFSPRLAYEHERVSKQVREGETVIDMFAGVGPFSILISKTHENIRVYAVDINSDAFKFLKQNVSLNHVEGKVITICDDARKIICQRLGGIADRVIMNLPKKGFEFIDVACKALKPEGGVIHFYEFASDEDVVGKAVEDFRRAVGKVGRRVREIKTVKLVKSIAPGESQIVVDAIIE
ncbi:MAG: class I SAM-dependent methyltransferase family protein [Candidatus Bathyarchaeota archaeon]